MENEQKGKMGKRWQKLQEMQGYTDEEMAIFRSNPKYVRAMEYSPKFMSHRIIVEVVEAHNCIAGHKAGDRIAVMTGNGHLVTEEMPKHVCAFGLFTALPRLYALWERFQEDLDPNGILFPFSHCPDVGCNNGGWGEIITRVYTEEVPKEQWYKLRSTDK